MGSEQTFQAPGICYFKWQKIFKKFYEVQCFVLLPIQGKLFIFYLISNIDLLIDLI